MWYCLFQSQEYGPFSTNDALDFIHEHPDCLIWREGMTEWMPVENFAILTDKSNSAPPASAAFSSDLKFQIHGDDMQYVEFNLEPQESVIAEPGSMLYKNDSVTLEALLSGNRKKGFFGRIVGASKRVLSGEKAFLSVFTNSGFHDTAKVAFSASYPGKIIPVSLKDFGGEIICQKDSFLCAQSDVEIGIYFQKKIFTALFGGAGFIMQRLTGDGVVFIHAGGAVTEIELKEGETLQTDIGSLVALQPGVQFDVEATGSFKSQIFGGSGVFFSTLKGPGKVWVQSLPFYRLTQKIISQIRIRQK